MADIDIPQHLIDAQRTADDAFEAIAAHRHAVNKPVLEWAEEENQRNRELWTRAQQAAEQLRTAINESGLEKEHGAFEFGYALRTKVHDQAETGTG